MIFWHSRSVLVLHTSVPSLSILICCMRCCPSQGSGTFYHLRAAGLMLKLFPIQVNLDRVHLCANRKTITKLQSLHDLSWNTFFATRTPSTLFANWGEFGVTFANETGVISSYWLYISQIYSIQTKRLHENEKNKDYTNPCRQSSLSDGKYNFFALRACLVGKIFGEMPL